MYFFFFFNDTATTEIYTLSLHDALPIYACLPPPHPRSSTRSPSWMGSRPKSTVSIGNGLAIVGNGGAGDGRSEEHTSELQSHLNLVCRLLLEKKKIFIRCDYTSTKTSN